MVAIAGAIIRQRNVRYPGLEGTMTYRSFHAAARSTFSEGERTALRPARHSASSSSSSNSGIRGCHSPGTGRITAAGSSWATIDVQRKRRPISKLGWRTRVRRTVPVEMSDRLADDRPVRGHSDHEKPGVARYTGPLHRIEGLRLDGSFLGTHPGEARPEAACRSQRRPTRLWNHHPTGISLARIA